MKNRAPSTLEIEITLMRMLNVRLNIVVPNVSWGMNLHECDLLYVTPAGYATEIEIKTTKSDLMADQLKRHKHESNMIKRFYFAVPENLKDVALEVIPERAGLYVIKWDPVYRSDYMAEKVRECINNKTAIKWNDRQRAKLAHLGTMRILGLKETISNWMNGNYEKP